MDIVEFIAKHNHYPSTDSRWEEFNKDLRSAIDHCMPDGVLREEGAENFLNEIEISGKSSVSPQECDRIKKSYELMKSITKDPNIRY